MRAEISNALGTPSLALVVEDGHWGGGHGSSFSREADLTTAEPPSGRG